MYSLKKSKVIAVINLGSTEGPVKELEQFKEHHRLKLFYNKGTKCANPYCNNIGTKIMINEIRGHIHVDVFTSNNIMMTVDHIIPKSKGGAVDDINNMQVLCTKCNSKKSNKLNYKF